MQTSLRRLVLVVVIGLGGSGAAQGESPYEPGSQGFATESDLALPLVSFVLPGLGQWAHGQYDWGGIYSGVAFGGLYYSAYTAADNDLVGRREREKEQFDRAGEPYTEPNPIIEDDVAERKVAWGLQVYQTMGGMSVYHTFRTAVRERQKRGEYAFLPHEETPGDIFMAPFRFSYLKRPSTLIPLGVVLALSAWQLNSELSDESALERRAFTADDAPFAFGFSYNAGTHEEAMFRGWMQPAIREYGATDFWANGVTSLLFAAAHLGSNNFPIAQALLGYHLGAVTMDNDWQIGEAVFIHTWWDVFAFAASYHYKRKIPDEQAVVPKTLWLPALKTVF